LLPTRAVLCAAWLGGGAGEQILREADLRVRARDAAGGWSVQTEERHRGVRPDLVTVEHLAGPRQRPRWDRLTDLARASMLDEAAGQWQARLRDRQVRADRSADLVDGILAWQLAAPSSGTGAPTPDSYVLAGTDPATGSAMTVTVTPAAGWVRLSATVEGIAAGEECQLLAVSRDGSTQIAGSWLVSPAGEENGTTLAGAALVAPDDLVAVRVENFDGREFVTASA